MRVTACMMVKDEEHNMPYVLQSLQDVVDEVVCVDTGSSDKTVMIAELYGAKVYHHPWQKNFSLHRNQSIDYATGDWLLIIDADERVVKAPNYKKADFISWLQDLDTQGYKAVALAVNDIQANSCAMNCNSARMFKKGYIRYENIIHNQPRFEGACVINHHFSLTHHGYDLSPEQMKKKFFRTKGLLYKEMRENPANYDVPFYLCQLYGHHGYNEKSRYWGEKYLALKDTIPKDKFITTIFFTMIRNYQEGGDLDKAEELLRESMRERPNDPDLAAALSDHGAMIHNNHLMSEGARRYITGYREMTENPALKGGQFYFSMKDEILTLNLYRLCIASLEEGVRCWEAVKPKISTMSTTLKDELKTNLTIIGMQQLLQAVPELSSLPDRAPIDVRHVQL